MELILNFKEIDENIIEQEDAFVLFNRKENVVGFKINILYAGTFTKDTQLFQSLGEYYEIKEITSYATYNPMIFNIII